MKTKALVRINTLDGVSLANAREEGTADGELRELRIFAMDAVSASNWSVSEALYVERRAMLES